jgi:hypothetical protein
MNGRAFRWAGFAFFAMGLHGQATSEPRFEVASVKAAPPPEGKMERTSLRLGPGTVVGERVTLAMMMVKAYSVKDFQIVGPDWITTEKYDIEAKPPEGASGADLLFMLQNLLIERFQLTLHRERKDDFRRCPGPGEGRGEVPRSRESRGGAITKRSYRRKYVTA